MIHEQRVDIVDVVYPNQEADLSFDGFYYFGTEPFMKMAAWLTVLKLSFRFFMVKIHVKLMLCRHQLTGFN